MCEQGADDEMSWRGDRYKLNDHGHEQAANQRACSRNGEIIRCFCLLSWRRFQKGEGEGEGELVAAAALKLAPFSPLSPVSSLVTKRRLRSGKR